MGFTVGQQIGINAAGSAIGGLVGLATSALQHKYNKDLADQNFAQNLTMWNKQNEYNTPTAQRKRLEDANLNPALMYGGGQVSAGNASQMPQYQQMGVDIGQNMLSSMQMAQMASNIRLTEARAEGQERENKYVDARNQAIIDNYLQDTKLKRSQEVHTYKLTDKAMVEMSSLQVGIDKMYQDIELVKEDVLTRRQQREIGELQKGLMVLEQVLTQAKTANVRADTDLKASQKGVAEAEKAYKEAATGQAKAQTDLIKAQEIYQRWKDDFVETYGVLPDSNLQQAIIQLLGPVSADLGAAIESIIPYGSTPLGGGFGVGAGLGAAAAGLLQ